MQVQEDTLKKTTQDLALLRKGGTTESHLGVLLDVFRKPKARGVVLDFLEARDILKIASSCKAARHYSLLGMRPMRHLFDHKKKELSVIQSSFEKALSKLAVSRSLQRVSQNRLLKGRVRPLPTLQIL